MNIKIKNKVIVLKQLSNIPLTFDPIFFRDDNIIWSIRQTRDILWLGLKYCLGKSFNNINDDIKFTNIRYKIIKNQIYNSMIDNLSINTNYF